MERVAELTVHPEQRGFIPGRFMLFFDNVGDALAPMHIARQLQDSVPASAPLRHQGRLPSVSWRWAWRVLHAISAPGCLVTAIRLLCEGFFSDIVFAARLPLVCFLSCAVFFRDAPHRCRFGPSSLTLVLGHWWRPTLSPAAP